MLINFDPWRILVVVDGERYAADELVEPQASAYVAAVDALPASATIADAADALARIVEAR